MFGPPQPQAGMYPNPNMPLPPQQMPPQQQPMNGGMPPLPPELIQLIQAIRQQSLPDNMKGTQDPSKIGKAFGISPNKMSNLLQTSGKKDTTTPPQQVPNMPQVGDNEFDPQSILQSVGPFPSPLGPMQPPMQQQQPQQPPMYKGMSLNMSQPPPMNGMPPQAGELPPNMPPQLLQMLMSRQLPQMNFGR